MMFRIKDVFKGDLSIARYFVGASCLTRILLYFASCFTHVQTRADSHRETEQLLRGEGRVRDFGFNRSEFQNVEMKSLDNRTHNRKRSGLLCFDRPWRRKKYSNNMYEILILYSTGRIPEKEKKN